VKKQNEDENGRDKMKYSICYDRTRLMETVPWERRGFSQSDNRIITPTELDQTIPIHQVNNNQQLMIRQSSQPDISSDFSIEMESTLPEYW